MTFTQRLWRYMMGLFMGTLLALFFFGSRSCSQWLPNEQVRRFLGEPGLIGDERTRCLMQCGAVTMADLRSLLEEGHTMRTGPRRLLKFAVGGSSAACLAVAGLTWGVAT